MEQLEQYYRDNFDTLCKSYAGRVGGLYNAEDVIQEAFARAIRYWNTYDPNKSSLATWFGKIARRAMYDFRAEETREGMTREEAGQEDEPAISLGEVSSLTMREIEREIDSLGEEDAEILRLSLVKSYRPREIVEIVDKPISAINSLLRVFRNQMKEKYGEHPATKRGS